MDEAQRQLASLSLGIVLLGPDQIIAGANPAAEHLLGQSVRRMQGRPLSELLAFDEARLAERLREDDAQLSARATTIAVAGLGRRMVDVTLVPLIDRAGWQVLSLHDIGGAEAMRETQASGEDRPIRAPEVLAHEIKNPLAGIRGAAQLLGRKLEGTDLALTTLIADEVDRIAKLIDQMQSLSRRSVPVLAPCNLHEAVRRARAVIEAGGRAPVIAEEFDPSLPLVMGSADALVQVLINLLSNAVEAAATAPQPFVTVRTRFASGLQLHRTIDGSAVRLPIEIRVSDNGPGIPADMRDHVFEPFVSTKKSGQGLGLALVRRLVSDMNGRITHDREEAKGLTHFRVHLPVADHRRPPSKEQAT
ncbi:MAG: ATP-binding protein [Novosphingobium sp.]|uniref:two-component system sensor histidine kinase NtrB n=1 Tax=Novosphingobium sp. TaxID=1874826 RepID=UPI003C7AF94F